MKRRHTWELWSVFVLVALTSACENAVTITGTITIPVEVQELFSIEQPGKLELWGTKLGGGGKAVLPYLCAASDHPLMVSYQFTTFGCAAEQEVQARAFRVAPDRLPDVRCGEPSSKSSGGLLGEELAYGATVIFQGRTGGSCQSASAVADLTLALTNETSRLDARHAP
jgi:hypothetical protein